MKSEYSLNIVGIALLVSTIMFSCQRNGGAKTTEMPTEETTTTTPVAEDTTPKVVDASGYGEDIPLDSSTISNAPTGTTYGFSLISHPGGTFGYEILENGKVLISQPNIPGESGNTGFPKKSQAAAAANLVIEKIKNGVTPPTISSKELKGILAE